MSGIAKRLFIEREGKTPWKQTRGRSSVSSYPLLEQMVGSGALPYIDLSIGREVIKPLSHATEAVVAFLCYLSLAMREGHLCIRSYQDELQPSPISLLQRQWMLDQTSLKDDVKLQVNKWCELVSEGLATLPSELSAGGSGIVSIQGQADGSFLVYFKNRWTKELSCAQALKEMHASFPSYLFDSSQVSDKTHLLTDSGTLEVEQAQAIELALSGCFTVICGGPGTGKTYTAGWLVKLLWEGLTEDHRQNFQIVLAAPTGKATSNLHASFCKVLGDTIPSAQITASTLHSLLGIAQTTRSSLEPMLPLAADLIVIDESSMIDVEVFTQLLNRVKKGARLILLGDPHQLPPVECAAIFSDLLKCYPERTITLKKCRRVELQAILEMASAIHSGDMVQMREVLHHGHDGVKFIALPDKMEEFHQTVLKCCDPFLSDLAKVDVENPLAALQQFRLLTPLRRGPYGSDALNQQICRAYLQKRRGARLAIPILVTANDPRLGLFNGDVGIVFRNTVHSHDSVLAFQPGDVAIFNRPEGIKRLPAILLPHVELSFAMTIHKSQGSEFDSVFLVLPEGSEWFGKELLYTGVTRAKRQITIASTDHTLSATIAYAAARQTGFAAALSR
jgi:exodeoxyribonuclease V alpha subunit